MYPEFVHELESESGESVDLRDTGTIAYLRAMNARLARTPVQLDDAEVTQLEPSLRLPRPLGFCLK